MTILHGCIYALWINGKPYIGQSRVLDKQNLPSKRWKRHIADSKDSELYLYRAIRKYGIEKKEVIEYITHECSITVPNCKYDGTIKTTKCTPEQITEIQKLVEKLNEAEGKHIGNYNSLMPELGGNGYNCAPPGEFSHYEHTEEHKQYISNLMKGQKRSEETKQKIRDVLKGVKLSDEHKKNQSAGKLKRFDTIIFPKRLQEWNEQYSLLQRRPRTQCTNIEEQKAGQWWQDMICKYKKGELNQSQIQTLTNTTGWIWEIPDEFMEQYTNWCEQIVKYGKNLVKESKTNIYAKKANEWMRRIRLLKRDNSKLILQEHIDILEQNPLWTWDSLCHNSFEKNVQQWNEFYTKKNRTPLAHSLDKEEQKVFNWQSSMRSDYKKKHRRMTEERIQRLESIIGWKWSN